MTNNQKRSVIELEFECRRKSKTESDKGVIYKVHFRSTEGHTLTLRDLTSAIFKGYEIGGKVTLEITNPQTSLEESQ